MQMTLASQGRSASAMAGALSGSGSLTLQSARIAGLDPRAFDAAIRASDNGQATDDIKLRQIVERRAVRRQPPGRIGAGSIQYQGRPAARRRDDARCRRRTPCRVRRLRYVGGSNRYSRGPDVDRDWFYDRAGNSGLCRRIARCARSNGRCRSIVVMAGGAGDRSRNPPAGFDRAWRSAAAGLAGVDSTARDGAASGCNASGRGPSRFADRRNPDPRARSAPPCAEAEGGHSARACAADSECACRQSAGSTLAAADRSPACAGSSAEAEAEAAAGADAAGADGAEIGVLGGVHCSRHSSRSSARPRPW